ncbi:MAG TPA: DNA-processing protein DprA [Candidatus Hydrothermia bacterium]|nr:DNA-processing protein DprA [Candidatus Hydrothermia bacterium]HOL23117.1 DNA-processing protein DprA [Candidatus Hydrothermia bacterium]HPO78127.1 DNA-processing protein DprA [Candidatus Hydrothermia bacterium]
MEEYIYTLYSIKGIGPVHYSKLVKYFGSAEKVFDAPLSTLKNLVPDNIALKIKNTSKDDIAQNLKSLEESKSKCIDLLSEEYPEPFRLHEMFPPVLFYRGKSPLITSKSIAVVGTRTPTRYGVEVAAKFISDLVENGFMIISGGARGIDTVAHKTALQKGGYTIAVLGCGIDVYYPPENRSLLQEIVKSGTILSEFLPRTKPLKENFPRRNRLIAGLSSGVLVVEAGDKSGALITARWALELGKEVYAVPGPINSPMSRGTNQLIRDGAKMVLGIEDILEDFGIGLEVAKNEVQEIELPPTVKKIFEIITYEPLSFDEILAKSKLCTPDLLAILFELEVDGFITELPGKYYKRKI